MTNCIDHGKYKSITTFGYAYKKVGGRVFKLHRLVYAEANGISIEDIKGAVVRHTCDNPRCINPTHLILGSHTDNMRDMVARGRSAKPAGELNGRVCLSTEQVQRIRELYIPNNKETGCRALARRFGVSPIQISRIINNQRWSSTSAAN